MEFNHSVSIQIRFNDVDAAQHVNNAVYQEYFDLGRVAYFKEVIVDPMDFDGVAPVIAGIKIDFYQPVFLYDRIRVMTKITRLGNKSMEMAQQIVADGEPAVRAVSVTVLVCFHYGRQVSVALSEDWKKKIILFEGGEVKTRQGK